MILMPAKASAFAVLPNTDAVAVAKQVGTVSTGTFTALLDFPTEKWAGDFASYASNRSMSVSDLIAASGIRVPTSGVAEGPRVHNALRREYQLLLDTAGQTVPPSANQISGLEWRLDQISAGLAEVSDLEDREDFTVSYRSIRRRYLAGDHTSSSVSGLRRDAVALMKALGLIETDASGDGDSTDSDSAKSGEVSDPTAKRF